MTGRPSNRLLFIGFHSTRDGSSPESQNELVAALLADHGFDIRSGSSQPRQIARMIDQLVLLLRNLGWADAVVVDAFSGRRFWTPVAVVRIARRVGLPAVVVLHGGRLPEFTQTHESRVLSTLRLASRLVAPSPYLGSVAIAAQAISNKRDARLKCTSSERNSNIAPARLTALNRIGLGAAAVLI